MLRGLWIWLCLLSFVCNSQHFEDRKDSLVHQRDAIDIGMGVLGRDPASRDLTATDGTGMRISAGPLVEYMKATGAAYGAAINGAFRSDASGRRTCLR